jgi:hypothetical protein
MGEKFDGYCVKEATGTVDRNYGQTKLNNIDMNTPERQQACLELCA